MLVLDSSGILRSGLDFSKSRYLIPNSVLQELKEDEKIAIEAGIQSGNIRVEDPSKEYVKKARDGAERTGDYSRLSETDLNVIALALEKKALIVSDDYAIQNVASFLGIEYEATTHEGIKKRIRWIKKCEGCGRIYKKGEKGNICPVCGSRLREIPKTQDRI